MDATNEVERGIEALLPRLWRFAITLTKDGPKAEDLVQDTCERMLVKAHRFEPGTQLDRWAFTLMANLNRDGHRRKTGHEVFNDEAASRVASSEPTPHEQCHASQVLTAISCLSEAQRSLVLLVYGEGLTYREAAAVVDAPIGTVMSRLHAARGALTRLGSEAAE